MRRWKIALAAIGLVLAGLAAWIGVGSWIATRPGPEKIARMRNFSQVGYSDLGGRTGFKMAMQVVSGRWYLYVAGLSEPGWIIVDVTDPARPRTVRFVPGPRNTLTGQIQVSHGLMLTGLQHPIPELVKTAPWHTFAWIAGQVLRGHAPIEPWVRGEEGVWIWDVSQPEQPRRVGVWRGGGSGTHRNFYNGGRYAYLAANRPGVWGEELVVLDLKDPRKPVMAAEWRLPEQNLAPGARPPREAYWLHGPAHVVGDRAYLPYGVGGAVILDVHDPRHPALVGRYLPPPGWGSTQGVHTFLPLKGRGLALINSEAHAESCRSDPGQAYAAVLDISNERAPRLLSAFPKALPPPGASVRSYCDRPARAGPHNQAHSNDEPYLFQSNDLTFIAGFSSGLRLYSTADPRRVQELGYFVPPDPRRRFLALPSRLVTQSEDVLVDARGYAYVTDKNQGVYIVRATSPEFLAELAPKPAPQEGKNGSSRMDKSPVAGWRRIAPATPAVALFWRDHGD